MRYYLTTAFVLEEKTNGVEGGDIFYEEFNKKALVRVAETRYPKKKTCINGEIYLHINISVLLYSPNADEYDAKEIAKLSLNKLNIYDYYDIKVREATFTEDFPEYCCYDVYDSKILKKGGLDEMYKFCRSHSLFHDWVCCINNDKKDLYENAAKTIHSEKLVSELQRIYDKKSCSDSYVSPVQYILPGSDKSNYWNSVDILCTALRENHRSATKHIISFNFDHISSEYHWGRCRFESDKELLDSINDNLANQISGNIIVIEYGAHDDGDNFDNTSYSCLNKFIECLRPYFCNTNIIFALRNDSPGLIDRIKKVTNVPIVNIGIDKKFDVFSHSYEEIYSQLILKAKEKGIKVNEDLKLMLKEKFRNKSFNDVESLLEEWRSINLINKDFPQYKPELQSLQHFRSDTSKSALDELNQLIGLKNVKEHINNLINRHNLNKELIKRGKNACEFTMHMAFLGNPGTGKTIVAKLYGQILKEAGLLSEGRIITVSGAEGFNVKKTFKKAKGSVLFIDEAYELCQGGYNLQDHSNGMVASLIAEMEENRNDTVVIFAGYRDSMNRLFNSNIGFRSRIGCILEFPDYSQDELLEIFKFMCNKVDLIIPKETLQDARDILWRGGRRVDQGNARYVRKFFEDCIGRQQVRLSQLPNNKINQLSDKELMEILPCDLNKNLSGEKSGREQLDELIGLDKVKQIITERIAQLKIQKLRRDSGIKTDFIPMHMVFSGNPGSGKTEVARLIGKILSEEGFLSNGKIYETHPGDMGFPGSFDSLFQKARGSVIFIDEAYGIANLHPIIVAELIKNLEDYREETVVIFAGYSKEMNKMLNSNPGFASRVKEVVNFEDYSVDSLIKILIHMSIKGNYTIAKSAFGKIKTIITEAKENENFGNGRFVRNLFEKAIVKQSIRLEENLKQGKTLSKYKLKSLLSEDFTECSEIEKNKKTNVGFVKKTA